MDPRGANFIVRPRAQNCLATPVIAKPSSLIVGDSPLWGENKTDQDLFVPRTRTTMTMSGSFSVIGPSPCMESPSTFSSCFFLIFQSFYVITQTAKVLGNEWGPFHKPN